MGITPSVLSIGSRSKEHTRPTRSKHTVFFRLCNLIPDLERDSIKLLEPRRSIACGPFSARNATFSHPLVANRLSTKVRFVLTPAQTGWYPYLQTDRECPT
jgi:hypothetical protein